MSGSAASRGLLITAGILGGLFVGVGFFTFVYARGGSYLSDDAAACANCHVMREQFEGWMKASHRKAAVCNDCHTPPGLAPKYFVKALNGFKHSWAFTTGWFPDQIRIGGFDRKVALQACSKCHAAITSSLQAAGNHRDGVDCLRCHDQVGHH